MSLVLDGSNLTTTGVINSGTAVASTSGISIDFTGIPAGVKRITVMFNGVSTSGTSLTQVQIGAGSVTITGYSAICGYISGTNTCSYLTSTTGFPFGVANASMLRYGALVLTLISGNTWVVSGSAGDPAVANTNTSGQLALGGSLDRVRITTVNGTDTFDAGSINILYE